VGVRRDKAEATRSDTDVSASHCGVRSITAAAVLQRTTATPDLGGGHRPPASAPPSASHRARSPG